MGWRVQDSNLSRGKRFIFPKITTSALGPTQLHVQCVKYPGHEVNHSLPFSAEVKNEAISPFPLHAFMMWTWKSNFIFHM
jgi:hypothetical protein